MLPIILQLWSRHLLPLPDQGSSLGDVCLVLDTITTSKTGCNLTKAGSGIMALHFSNVTKTNRANGTVVVLQSHKARLRANRLALLEVKIGHFVGAVISDDGWHIGTLRFRRSLIRPLHHPSCGKALEDEKSAS